jgi:hypothetical protein
MAQQFDLGLSSPFDDEFVVSELDIVRQKCSVACVENVMVQVG